MEMICIVCPVGCRMTVEEKDGALVVTGNACRRGITYAEQEARSPMRTLTSLVQVAGGAEPLCPVKTRTVIPKAAIPKALGEIRGVKIDAPVKLGDVIIRGIAGTDVDLIATANRRRA
ncbi:MAG: DUF1667 domain-containing protein [Christensenellales bacterium]|jgi:CxxC motif-containing protein